MRGIGALSVNLGGVGTVLVDFEGSDERDGRGKNNDRFFL